MAYGGFGAVPDINGVLTGVGYSNTALVTGMCWLGALLLVCVLVACILKYPAGLPLGGTNSAVISASCQLGHERRGHSFQGEDDEGKAVMWGVTVRGGEDEVGHCSFSAEDVEWPTSGHLYAGYCKLKPS
jgi:hypothetical protein